MTVVGHFTLLVILLAAAVGTAAAQGTPKQGTSTEKSSLKSGRAKQPDQSHETVEKVPPTADKPAANLTDTHAANSSEDKETQRKLVEFTKWLAIVGGLQLLALIVQAIVFWRTLDQVKAQANLMRVHADHLENLVAAGQANAEAARNNAIATKDSASALINSERAWVMAEIEGDRGKWADGKVHIVEGSGTSGDSTGTWIILGCKNEGNKPGWIYAKRSIFHGGSSPNALA